MPEPRSVTFGPDVRTKRDKLVVVAAELAVRQQGLVSAEQLLERGVSRSQIKRAVASGLLVRVARGVYALGYVPRRPETRTMAAVLAIGGDAQASHLSAAFLHRLLRRPPARVEISTRRHVRPRKGIIVHERRTTEGVVVDGIPVTTVERTVVDLAQTPIADRLLRRAVRQAQVEHGASWERLAELARAERGAAGRRIRAVLGVRPAPTRSEAEDAMLALLEEHDFPAHEPNLAVAGEEADVVFVQLGLVVEVDSRAFHSSQIAQEDDRRKQATWEAAGWTVVRVTWDEIFHARAKTVLRLRRAVEARRAVTRALAA